jgi:hypothetical protein
MRVMKREVTSGRQTTRRYTKRENDQAVRLVFEVREELEYDTGTLVADQLGTGRNLCAAGVPRLRPMLGM